MLTKLSRSIATPAQIALSSEPGTVVAAAIGTRNCNVVVLQYQWDGTCAVQQAAELQMNPGVWEQPRELGKAINQWLSDMALPKTIPIACILPAGMVEYESLELPDGELDLNEYVASRMEEILGHEANAVTHAYWQAGSASQPDHLYLSWTPSAFATELANNLSLVGRECIALEPLATVLAQIGLEDDLSDNTSRPYRLVVFLEENQATTVLADSDLPAYVRSQIGLCEQSPQQLAQHNLKISPQSASTLLRDWGISGSSPSGTHVAKPVHQLLAGAIQPWTKGLVFELQRTLRFLKHRYGVSELKQVILCGENAKVAGLADHLTQELDQSVCPAQIPTACRWLSAQPHCEAFAVPLALAMRGVVT